MKKLFVGCKVRIVDNGNIAPLMKVFIGKEGIITAPIDPFMEVVARLQKHDVHWQVVLIGDVVYAHSDCLEPILPEGHRACGSSFQELMERLNSQKVENDYLQRS